MRFAFPAYGCDFAIMFNVKDRSTSNLDFAPNARSALRHFHQRSGVEQVYHIEHTANPDQLDELFVHYPYP
jgi:hypothetical protein